MALRVPPTFLPATGEPALMPLGAPVSLRDVAGLLEGLDREQRRAVTHGDGPLLVVAGPGTGKTEVITRRIAWLVATKRARPQEILALTFTDRAADEMQARVDVLVPYGQAEAGIHTFHAFGDRLVREFAFEMGAPPDLRLVDRAGSIMLLREHLFELGLERYRPLADPTRFLGALVERFARAKDEGLAPDDLLAHADRLAEQAGAAPEDRRAELVERAAAERELAVAWQRYQRLLLEHRLMDFGDQVSGAARLLRESAAVRAEVQRRYRYIVVDEFQDTNPVQLDLLSLLAGRSRNVVVVGDDDQSIYTFRGAALGNILGFGEAFPGARRVVLRRNHRSRSPILVAATRLVRHNDPYRLEAREGLDKRPVAVRRGRGARPVAWRCYTTPDEEADAVAAAIAGRIQDGLAASDQAVLVRTNADAAPVIRSLALHGIPVRTGTGSGLFSRPEVRQLVSFLRVVAEPGSTVDLYGVMTGEPYGVRGAEVSALLEVARRHHRSLWSVLCELETQPRIVRLDARVRGTLDRLRDDVRAAVERSHERSGGEVLYEHLQRSGRLRALVTAAERGDDAPLRRVSRLFEMLREASDLLPDDRMPFLVRHLDTLVESGSDPQEPDAPDEDRDAVAVLTVHKAKGLEFPVVHLVGLVDGRFPLRGRGDRLPLPPDLARRLPVGEEQPHAEERRLCYVAMTRARDELHLSWSRRSRSGRAQRPSPFLAEALDMPVERLLVTESGAEAPDALVARIGAGLAASEAAVAPSSTPVSSPGVAVPERALELSFSRIDDYLTCPLKHRLRHELRVPTPPHHSLVLGNALHQAAAAFQQARSRGREMADEELVAVLDAHWRSEGFLSRAHEDARYAAARDALLRFRARELAAGVVPSAVERPFSVVMDGVTVRGRFDRVDETAAGTVITDLKSSDVRDQRVADQKARDSLQLQLYALAHEAETGRLPAKVRLEFLDSGVSGTATPDATRLARARERVATAADGIRRGDATPRPDVIGCGYCPYRRICPSSAA